jgi:hypothetical protein
VAAALPEIDRSLDQAFKHDSLLERVFERATAVGLPDEKLGPGESAAIAMTFDILPGASNS